MIQIFINLFKRCRRFLFWIWRQEGSPGERARGIAVGVFSGCFPFFGFQTLLGIALASLFRGNHLLAISGTWISNPLTYVPLYWFNYRIGAFLLGQDNQFHELEQLTQLEMWNQGWIISIRILLGSSIVGSIAGVIIGCIFYIIFKSLSNHKTFI